MVLFSYASYLTNIFASVMSGLCSILTSPGGGSPSKEDLQLIQALLTWPSQYSFPGTCHVAKYSYSYVYIYFTSVNIVSFACLPYIGLDLLRLAPLSENGLKFFFGDGDNGQVFLGELFASAVYVCLTVSQKASCLLVVVRSFCDCY